MVIQALGHQVQRQRVLNSRSLLDFGPLVLEPDFDLRLIKAQLVGQALPPLLRQVPVRLELRLQALQLLGREGGARPLVLLAAAAAALLWSAGSGTCGGRGYVELE